LKIRRKKVLERRSCVFNDKKSTCFLFYFQILPVAIAKGQIAQPISARLTACKLLGKIATKFEPYM
jgi:hypothetical protein